MIDPPPPAPARYVVDKGMRFAKHCRFHFCHFVTLCLRTKEGDKAKDRDVTLARTGKDLVLPREPGAEEAPSRFHTDAAGEHLPLRPTRELGATVVDDPAHGKDGLVMPIRWNPLEGSSNGPSQVGLRGNVDYQNMMRTLKNGFIGSGAADVLRGEPMSVEEQAALDETEEAEFEASLPARVQAVLAKTKWSQFKKTAEEVEEELRTARARRRERFRKMGPAKRFFKTMRTLIVDGMKNSIQAMFYACDYSTKPNMVCAPLMVAVQYGVQRLEERLRWEEDEARREELEAASPKKAPAAASTESAAKRPRRPLSKIEDEARRRLIRQATATNQAIVKGNCLMAMQILTGREVLRTHFAWQLMMKHAMWMAFQHRRERQGFDEREPQDIVTLGAAEADSSSDPGHGQEGDEPDGGDPKSGGEEAGAADEAPPDDPSLASLCSADAGAARAEGSGDGRTGEASGGDVGQIGDACATSAPTEPLGQQRWN